MGRINYDVDKDTHETGGRRGMALADAILKRAGGFEAYFLQAETPLDARKKRESGRRPRPVDYENDLNALEIIARVALMPFAPQERGERIYIKEIKERLSELMHMGYPVLKGFRNMSRGAAWSYLEDIQKEMDCLLGEKLPKAYAEIQSRNQRWSGEAY